MYHVLIPLMLLTMSCSSTCEQACTPPRVATGRVIPVQPDNQLNTKIWIGGVFFHWYGMNDNGLPNGQWYSPWPPLEGRDKWDGSVGFYARQTMLYRYAGFNMIPFQDVHDRTQDQRNHLEAIKLLGDVNERRKLMSTMNDEYQMIVFPGVTAEELVPPKVSPFIDQGSFPEAHRVKDFTKQADKEEFYTHLSDMVRDMIELVGYEGLTYYKNKLLVNVWYVPGAESAKRDFYPWVSDALYHEFGIEAYFSVHHAWKTAGADEFNYLFSGKTDLVEWNAQGNVDLLVGYWPPDNAPHSYWVPRDGGKTLKRGLDIVLGRIQDPCADRVKIIWVESYNEYTEGSGVYPGRCGQMPADAYSGEPDRETCVDTPCIAKTDPSWYDVWGDCSNPRAPFLYLDMLREYNNTFLNWTNNARDIMNCERGF